jgi:hypothetical protein
MFLEHKFYSVLKIGTQECGYFPTWRRNYEPTGRNAFNTEQMAVVQTGDLWASYKRNTGTEGE